MIDSIKKLTVKYNGRIVGYLAELENAVIAFQYEDGWLREGFSISPFSLPLKKDVFVNKKDTFNGLYGVFQDSLPDGWGELLFRRMVAKRGLNPDRISPLTRLSLLGENGLGALTYEPCQSEETTEAVYALDDIANEIRQILDDKSADADLDVIYRLGGSSGGARPKAHMQDGDGFWIVKFPTHLDPKDVGEREYRANAAAKSCGLHVNESKLFPSKLYAGYFGAKRFDRIGTTRMHMVSLSSLLETTHRIPNLDYINLFQVIQNICVDKGDLYEAYRRMCFNVLYGNRDDHGKNFAFLYDETLGGYKLSPAYDITKTAYKPEHEMSVNGTGKPRERDLLEVADSMKLSMSECKKILERMKAELSAHDWSAKDE